MASTRQKFNPLDRLVVALPLAELGYQQFWQYLLANRDFGYLVNAGRVLTLSGGYVHGSHNELVREALGKGVPGWKRLLWLEHDHTFPEDVFLRHARYTEPIVGGIYVLRDVRSPLPVFYNWDANRYNALLPNAAEIKYMLDNPGLHKVDMVPMGCTSIRREIFETWPKDKPWYTSASNPTGTTMSDDIWFCRIAQDNGWQSYIDTSLKVNHLTRGRAPNVVHVTTATIRQGRLG